MDELIIITLLIIASTCAILEAYLLGFLTFKYYFFWRARNSSTKLDPSNIGQTDMILAQGASHIDWFFKMYFLSARQIHFLRLQHEEPIKCFPHLGKDLGDYAMQRPPE